MAVAPRMERISLSRAPEDLTHLPNLIEIQTRSYTDFLQWEVPLITARQGFTSRFKRIFSY
jgi:hypothetical protein